MAVRTTSVDKWNYTNRKRIKQKPELFLVEQVSRSPNKVTLRVQWNEAEILQETRIESSTKRLLVLDALFLGNTQRFELPAGGTAEEFVIEECPDNAILEFRLKLVSNEKETLGVLLAATSPFKLKTGSGPNEGSFVNSGFFHPELSDSLGWRIWAVTWPAPDAPVISLNRSYFEKSKDKPFFAAHLFPEILRAVIGGILLRNDDLEVIEEQSSANEWLNFVEQVLEFPLRGDDAELEAGNEERLELVEKIVTAFADRKWRNGKTLLEELIYMELRQFNDQGVEAFKALIEAEREKVEPRKPALVAKPFFSDVDALANDPEMTIPVSGGEEIDTSIQFKDRFHMGDYLSQVLPSDLAVVQHSNAGLWAWISAIYFRQLLERQKMGGRSKLWSAYRYIPGEYQKFRYYRHLAFMAFWLRRAFGEEVAKFFLSPPAHAHSDAMEQLYTQDRDFLASKGLMKAAVEMYIDPTTGMMKRNTLGKATPGSARRLATKIAKQLQVNYDLQSMGKDEIYALLPTEFNDWRPTVTGA